MQGTYFRRSNLSCGLAGTDLGGLRFATEIAKLAELSQSHQTTFISGPQLDREIDMKRLLIASVFILLIYSPALGETFDYDGSALIDCSCPTPSANNTCTKPDADWKFTYSIGVNQRITVDLADLCFRRREDPPCCGQPRTRYRGTVGKRCPGKSSCS